MMIVVEEVLMTDQEGTLVMTDEETWMIGVVQGETLIVMTEGHEETLDEMIVVLDGILVMIEVLGVTSIVMIVVQGGTLVEIETLIEVHAEIWIEMIGAL